MHSYYESINHTSTGKEYVKNRGGVKERNGIYSNRRQDYLERRKGKGHKGRHVEGRISNNNVSWHIHDMYENAIIKSIIVYALFQKQFS